VMQLDLDLCGKVYPRLMADDALRIGEVAARSGVTRKALRLYEARGIVPTPRRTPQGIACTTLMSWASCTNRSWRTSTACGGK